MPPATDASRRIAATVSTALRDAGISQKRAALGSGMSLATIERRLTGLSPFNTDELEALANILGMSVFDIVRRAESHAA